MSSSTILVRDVQIQSNPNQKLIKTVKVWIGLDLVFYKPLGSDLIFKTNPI